MLDTKVPSVPTTEMVPVPTEANGVAESVRTLVCDPEMTVGLNCAVTPEGSPVAERVRVPVNPLSGVKDMVLVLLAPSLTLTVLGAAAKV